MSNLRPAAGFLIPLALLLAGCANTYTVDLTNSTRITIQAQLEIESLGSGQRVLTRAVVSPGEFRRLGPVGAPITDRVRISVTPASGSGGFPERRRLERGKTLIEAADDAFGGASISLTARRDP